MSIDTGDVASVLLNGFVIAVFGVKFGYVLRAYVRRGGAADLHDLVVGLVLLAGAIALAVAAWTLRFADTDTFIDVIRVVISWMRVVLLVPGLWLLLYWTRR